MRPKTRHPDGLYGGVYGVGRLSQRLGYRSAAFGHTITRSSETPSLDIKQYCSLCDDDACTCLQMESPYSKITRTIFLEVIISAARHANHSPMVKAGILPVAIGGVESTDKKQILALLLLAPCILYASRPHGHC